MSGIFAVNASYTCSKDLFYGTDYHSHLGTKYAGLAVFSNGEVETVTRAMDQNQFKSQFKDVYKTMLGNFGVGFIGDEEQPLKINSRLGTFAVCTDGLIYNNEELTKKLMRSGMSFSKVKKNIANNSELVAQLISRGENIVDGINNMYDSIQGSISLALISKEGIYAVADRSPLVIGKKQGAFAVASESCAFPNLGYEPVRDIGRREIVLIRSDDVISLSKPKPGKICSFKWIYTGSPASCYESINAGEVRERCGAKLAERDLKTGLKADLVAGVPDSGVYHAIGYANRSGIPFGMSLMKYTPGYGRSYTPLDQIDRNEIATYKLIPVKSAITGKRIVILEDSIVRGTQLKNRTVIKLRNNGAIEVHVRPACPPLMYPCIFDSSTRNTSELITRKMIRTIEGVEADNIDVSEYLKSDSDKYGQMVELIRQYIAVDSLTFQTLDDMVDAIGLPKEKLCTHCWDGSG